ncbi:hypothetical protein [Plantactinospora sp. CA-290183]|uniref:hypothetical protein n=1 Tax=Plantactinospora sp. CA-290183 TaxID=3240006 RepID=UPI003D8ACCA3
MGSVRDKPPSQWDCVVFLAVARHKSKKRAVESLSAEYQESITTKGVDNIVRKIDDWLKEKTFKETYKGNLELTIRGKRFLRFANKIVSSYQEERRPTTQRLLPKIVCLPHHVSITSRLECDLRHEHPDHEDQVIVEELGQGLGSDEDFEDEALFPLTLGHHEITIGNRTAAYEEELQSDLLYAAQLEAMVPAEYPREQLGLAELVTAHRAMLPTENSRSRRLLADRIAGQRIEAPPKELWVAADTYGMPTAVHRVAEDHQRFGSGSKLVVVAPSDVALLYKGGSRFGGSGVEASKWVPLHHEQERLELGVYVTTTNPRPNHLRPIVDRIKRICEELPELGGTRPAQRIPRQGRDSVRSRAARRN